MDPIYEASCARELEYWHAIAKSFEGFQRSQLSDTTLIRYTVYQPNTPAANSKLASTEDIRSLKNPCAESSLEFFFIHKFLILNHQDEVPNDANRLRISGPSFETLAIRLKLSPAFIFALSRHSLPNGRGSRQLQINSSTALDFWYFLPIRIQVESAAIESRTPEDTSSPNQMNPFHKLHLPSVKLDIRRSCVGIFTRVEPDSKRVTFLAFDFMHGRWPKVALEPRQRIDEVIRNRKGSLANEGYGYFIHLVYLSSAVRWWTNALNSVNEQLIAYELELQTELSARHITSQAVFTGINRALHSIAAHLHRYLSELKSLHGIVVELTAHFEYLNVHGVADDGRNSFDKSSRGFSQVLSQIEALCDFAEELEKKIKNNLALLFNRIQINNDRLLVENGQAMQAILSAMQEDTNIGRKMAKASHSLAREMRRDSVAMRTIAIVTMFFLPGATFAALLSMPFFSNNKWLEDASRFWIWIVMTVPSTAACFLFYHKWISKSHRSSVDDDMMLMS